MTHNKGLRKLVCRMVSNYYLQKQIYSWTHLASNRFGVFNIYIGYLKFVMQLRWNRRTLVRFYCVQPLIMCTFEFMPAQIYRKQSLYDWRLPQTVIITQQMLIPHPQWWIIIENRRYDMATLWLAQILVIEYVIRSQRKVVQMTDWKACNYFQTSVNNSSQIMIVSPYHKESN